MDVSFSGWADSPPGEILVDVIINSSSLLAVVNVGQFHVTHSSFFLYV